MSVNAQKTIPVSTGNNQGIEIGFGPTKYLIKLDPLTMLPVGNIPFDRTFILRVYFDNNNDKDVSSFYLHDKDDKEDKENRTPLSFYLPSQSLSADKLKLYDKSDDLLSIYNAIDIIIPPLYPNHDYELIYATVITPNAINNYLNVFKLFYDGKIEEGKKLQTAYKGNDKGIPTEGFTLQYYNDYNIKQFYDKYNGDSSKANIEIVTFIKKNTQLNTKTAIGLIRDFFNPINSYTTLSKVGTYVYTVQSSSKLRIVADGGVIYTGWQKGFNTVTPYFGINISLRPMDTDIPFRSLVKNKRIKCYQRFTMNLGVTINSIAKDNYRTNLFSNNNVMVGLGYKVSHVLNLNLGGLLYNNINSNPLIATKSIGVAPYVGLSINLLIKDALGDIAKIFSK
jgi:hypothetical protein